MRASSRRNTRSGRCLGAQCTTTVVLVATVLLLAVYADAQSLLDILTSSANGDDPSRATDRPTWQQSAAGTTPSGGRRCRMEKEAAHAYCGLPYELSNFQGHYRCNNTVMVGRPTDWQQAADLVKAYSRVKAVGVGHSWWKEQFCSGTDSSAINIVTTEFINTTPAIQGDPQASVTIDEANMIVTAAAGVTQRTLLKFLDGYRTAASPEGYTLPAFSWFIDQTIAGAVSTASHGSSFLFGSLSSQVKALKLMDAHGNILTITPADSHLWKAATVSVGRLGIILEVTMSLVKNAGVKRERSTISTNDLVTSVSQLQQQYTAARVNNSLTSLAVWQAVKPWNEVQLFWFIPSEFVWRVSYTRLQPVDDATALQVVAMDGEGAGDGSSSNGPPPGAYQQQEVQSAGSGVGIEVNPRYWSDLYSVYMTVNVDPATLPARKSYVSVSELENRITSAWNSYDQYEVAIPLTKAGDCLAAVHEELYGANERWKGFRSPVLLRFIRAEQSYLSPSNGEYVIYINLEDHVSYATGKPNEDFQAIISLLRSPVCGTARLHWGKAGWPQYAKCFDGATEYPATWCDFGCAVQQLDPTGKFSSEADRNIWQWNAVEQSSGLKVEKFAECCSSTGFDHERCRCAPRTDCTAR